MRHSKHMTHIEKSVAALRVFGDDLIPDEISQLLGCLPTKSYIKGEIVRGKKTGREYTKKTGMWLLEAGDREPENLDAQVAELLGKLTSNLAVWSQLNERFDIDLGCGLFAEESNVEASLTAETLLLLGERGIELWLDFFGPIQEVKDNGLCPCNSGETYANCCKPGV